MGDTTTILIVDDEVLVRTLAERVLRASGFEVITAANGTECLECHRLSGERIALTVLDYSMPPGPNGAVVFDELMRKHPATKVLFASGSADDGLIADLIRRGMCSAIRKPYRSQELVDAVNSALEHCDPVRRRGQQPHTEF